MEGYHPLQLAPMLDVTDRHFRMFCRGLSKKMQIWTEMVVSNTVVYSPEIETILKTNVIEHPVILQLGGDDAQQLAAAAQRAMEIFPFDGINLNCGCPSNKVAAKGCFGAALMKTPTRVAAIVDTLAKVVDVAISVKTRIGVDDLDSEEFLREFIETVSASGNVRHFQIHARKAWLNGVNPKQNRSVPGLNYQRVLDLVTDYPHLSFTLNGGLKSVKHVKSLLEENPGLAGCMIGRAIRDDPCAFAHVDSELYGEPHRDITRRHVMEFYIEYLRQLHATGTVPVDMKSNFVLAKPVLGILTGLPGAKYFRRAVDSAVRDQQIPAYQQLQRAMSDVERRFPCLWDIPVGQEPSQLNAYYRKPKAEPLTLEEILEGNLWWVPEPNYPAPLEEAPSQVLLVDSVQPA